MSAIGTNVTEMTHHELMSRGHAGIQKIWSIEAPIIVAIQGWAIGGSFQRALLCDVRIAAEDARFMLPNSVTVSSPTPAAWGCCTRCAATDS